MTILNDAKLAYLTSKGLSEDTASNQHLSDAISYATAYKWYITTQNVTPENAAIAAKIWVQKYALHDADGVCVEATPADMWSRVARVLADEEKLTLPTSNVGYNEFYDALSGFKYMPQGSGLFALGNKVVNSSASNCFVLPSPVDNLESIFDTARDMARIYAYRGGCGIDLSGLRPAGAATKNAARTSTGAASFMDFYSQVTNLVGQAGRRGALMLTMRVDHPDIFRFIRMKRDLEKKPFIDACKDAGINLNSWEWSSIHDRLKSTSFANVSVRLTDKFVAAVKADEQIELWFDYLDNEYPRYSEFVSARAIWDELMQGAWEAAEPGILNWDLIKRESPADCYSETTYYQYIDPKTGDLRRIDYSFETLSTNPCGEVPLSGGDSCCLGTFFLPAFVKNPYTPDATFDYEEFAKVVSVGVRAQDNIKNWDARVLPLAINRAAAILGRRISLGTHGLSDCMAMLGLRYDSKDALEFAETTYAFLKNTVYATSVLLAKEKGAFPAWDWEKEKNNPFLQRLDSNTLENMKEYGRRNIACLTNAPTGSMAILSRNSSSGIEPVFKLGYDRLVKKPGSNDTEKFTIYHQAVQDCIDAGGDISVFIEAGNIDPYARVLLQATIQRHIDHAISVTTNLREDATVELVSSLYMNAFELGCKGMTVYRENSRTGVLVSSDAQTKRIGKVVERPKTTEVDIHKMRYKDRAWAVLIGKLDGKPIEVFAGIEEDTPLPNKYHKAELTKKSRGHYTLTVHLSGDADDIMRINDVGARFPAPEGMALTRLISMAFRNGVPVSDITEQLQKAASSMFDYPAVLARVLKQYVSEEEFASKHKGKPCPDCGKELKFRKQDGCMVEYCVAEGCGFQNSKCG